MLGQAMRVATWADCIFLATVDRAGRPSFTHVEKCRRKDENHVSILSWMDTTLLSDRARTSSTAVLIWDTHREQGFQLIGRAVHTDQAAILDGYTSIEDQQKFVQAEREIAIEVDGVIPLRVGVSRELM